ncbi:hypothetical protein [Nocardia sp. NPDC051463]|uniref:hypothetical protein n=1 Tax=Nocardia sp. NPDC051463 TaxID=3154845 RepID=UPI00344C3CEA
MRHTPPKWSRAGFDRVHQRYGVTSPTDTAVAKWKQVFGRGPSMPALWARNAKTEALLFSDAHAVSDVYIISVEHKGALPEVDVDGGNFGRILAGNPHLLEAYHNHPNSLLIQLSCSPGTGPAAEASARALHEANFGTDVYAAKAPVVIYSLHNNEPVFRGLSVEAAPGRAEDHWAVYRAPRGRAAPADG